MTRYLSAAKLGISLKEKRALIQVRDMLKAKRLKHESTVTGTSHRQFNMADPGELTECGTVACIGGWMSLCMKFKDKLPARFDAASVEAANDYVDRRHQNSPLTPLFYPSRRSDGDGGWEVWNWRLTYSNISTAEAAKAIDNFLKTRNPQWGKVLNI